MYINEIMSTDVKVCKADSNLEEVGKLMFESDCGAIPVVNAKQKPIGIITDRDIAMTAALSHKPLWEIKADSIVSKQRLCSSHQEDTLEDCLRLMEQNGVRRIPVVGEDGRLVGIVSMGDVLAFTNARAAKAGDGKTLAVDPVLAMLKHVSAHHESNARPVISAS